MKRYSGAIAARMAGRGRACNHHLSLYEANLFLARTGWTCSATYSKGASYSAAADFGVSMPKSTMKVPRGRRVMSIPFTRGTTTSLLGRPLTLVAACNIPRATVPEMSNGPVFRTPRNAKLWFSGSTNALVRSMSLVRSALMAPTEFPFKCRCSSEPSSCPTIETRTAAPSTIHGSSDHAMKMSPDSFTLSRTRRFAPPRILFVANRPARSVVPRAICRRVASCQ